MQRVAFIGAGAMGRGMIKNLLQKGYAVTAYDVSRQACDHVAQLGATLAGSPAEAARGADLACLSLPGPADVENSVVGEAGVLQELKAGSFIIDLSTIDPGTTRRLWTAAKERGVFFLDAPVSGGPVGADKGTLTIMVGGDKEAFDIVHPVLVSMGRDIFYMGESGMGQVVKLVHNMVGAATAVALGEALLAGSKAGLSREAIADVLRRGVARCGTLEVFGANIISETYPVIFALKHMYKDLSLYMRMTEELRVPTLLGSLVHQLYRSAYVHGWGDMDHTVVCRVVREMS